MQKAHQKDPRLGRLYLGPKLVSIVSKSIKTNFQLWTRQERLGRKKLATIFWMPCPENSIFFSINKMKKWMDKRIRNGRKSSADVAQKPNLDAFSFNNHVWLCFLACLLLRHSKTVICRSCLALQMKQQSLWTTPDANQFRVYKAIRRSIESDWLNSGFLFFLIKKTKEKIAISIILTKERADKNGNGHEESFKLQRR